LELLQSGKDTSKFLRHDKKVAEIIGTREKLVYSNCYEPRITFDLRQDYEAYLGDKYVYSI
jgi:hypothetical protein